MSAYILNTMKILASIRLISMESHDTTVAILLWNLPVTIRNPIELYAANCLFEYIDTLHYHLYVNNPKFKKNG